MHDTAEKIIIDQPPTAKEAAAKTTYAILFAISFSHLLNDTIQSLIPAIYPIIKESFQLSFSQIGLITFTFQLAASLLQPVVGHYTDRNPRPYSLVAGMGFTLIGVVLLSLVDTYGMLLVSVAFIGVGSSIFHPEASRMAHVASGGKRGLAQSIFQVGGNTGSSLGPLLAALVVARFGRSHMVWFALVPLLAIVVLRKVGGWYRGKLDTGIPPHHDLKAVRTLSRNKVIWSVSILLVLIFSKFFYLASMSNYLTFYLIDRFGISVKMSQMYLFIFIFSTAAGTLIGGPVGDRIGRKYVIWGSILGVAPFSLLLPYVSLAWTGVLIVFIGIILASAFSAILVYAQELIPGKTGLVSGLFFGLAFGMAGIGSALLGRLADHTSINYVYHVCAYLPLIGIIAGLLPNIEDNVRR